MYATWVHGDGGSCICHSIPPGANGGRVVLLCSGFHPDGTPCQRHGNYVCATCGRSHVCPTHNEPRFCSYPPRSSHHPGTCDRHKVRGCGVCRCPLGPFDAAKLRGKARALAAARANRKSATKGKAADPRELEPRKWRNLEGATVQEYQKATKGRLARENPNCGKGDINHGAQQLAKGFIRKRAAVRARQHAISPYTRSAGPPCTGAHEPILRKSGLRPGQWGAPGVAALNRRHISSNFSIREGKSLLGGGPAPVPRPGHMQASGSTPILLSDLDLDIDVDVDPGRWCIKITGTHTHTKKRAGLMRNHKRECIQCLTDISSDISYHPHPFVPFVP